MPNMLQIEPSQATGATKEAFDEAKRQFGGVINLFKVTGNAPNVLKGFLALNASVNDGIELTGKEIEQVAMLVSALNRCDYCVNVHMKVGQMQGGSETEMLAAMEGRDNAIGEDKIKELMAAVDEYIPTPERAVDQPFLMPIEDVFSISGRGTVVTGRVERGVINVGDSIEIVGIKDTQTTTCTGVEMFRKLLDRGEAGDNIGALLRGVDREAVERGQVLCKPGSVNPHTKFEAEAYILTKEEGGRHTPFFANYRPQFYFRTTDVTGTVTLPEGTEMVMPGDNLKFAVELIAPIAMEDGLRFAIREGGRTVGAGVVSKIIE